MRNVSRAVTAARMTELGRKESLALLASVPLGRVGFTQQALPVIRPVNHVVDGDAVVIGTQAGSVLLCHTSVAEVVVYEADQIDPQTRTGWSVMVTGPATPVTAPLEVVRYQGLLTPWADMSMHHVVRIRAELVTGYRLEH
ncbi:pyridoxamine 5'-phosphate oxidase family protein [Streptomyces sp. TLI_185]|uniref:pyridoxamine 5'-phosphate oxidase family protein n=1 Tax=Streptomyces sp. TLI_185 TaxID=2485151 RepID=UPI000F4E85FC|nr:pyridoxamine 5'-phosphate oxidase family protein [Streptomyces sp. TLI_185]RPF38325.1 pyridoxamine 5'-phosphate oxidase-like protein [Streptomyces sp. TLI_185]